jgi:hypothetical protein
MTILPPIKRQQPMAPSVSPQSAGFSTRQFGCGSALFVSHFSMPTEYYIDLEHRVVVSSGAGVFRYSDYLAHVAKVGRDPHFDPALSHLIDCRAFDSIDLSAEELQLAAARSNFSPTTKRAFVADSSFKYGLSRMFVTLGEIKRGQDAMVFRTLAEALAWLGLPANYDPAIWPRPVHVEKPG